MTFCSCKNAQLSKLSNLDERGDSFEQRTLTAPSNTGLLNAPIPTFTLTKYTKEDFQGFTKLCINLFFQAQAGYLKNHWEKELKARFPDLYYKTFHMKCYYFRQYMKIILILSTPTTSIIHLLFLYFFVVESAFVDTSISIKKTRPKE